MNFIIDNLNFTSGQPQYYAHSQVHDSAVSFILPTHILYNVHEIASKSTTNTPYGGLKMFLSEASDSKSVLLIAESDLVISCLYHKALQ